ncbi:hypothetical protein FM117_04850 [Micrococcus luteus Mu201]|nr:hypothetical protein FM117_04850 [Micrococcus luteus Mu201]
MHSASSPRTTIAAGAPRISHWNAGSGFSPANGRASHSWPACSWICVDSSQLMAASRAAGVSHASRLRRRSAPSARRTSPTVVKPAAPSRSRPALHHAVRLASWFTSKTSRHHGTCRGPSPNTKGRANDQAASRTLTPISPPAARRAQRPCTPGGGVGRAAAARAVGAGAG